MSNSNNWLEKNPKWVLWSFLPVFGGLAISYAGYKSKESNWLYLGLGITTIAILLASTKIGGIIWLSQIGIAFYLKKTYLIKTSPQNIAIPDAETAQLLAEIRGQIDINNSSKHDLVYQLNMPIVYANDIELLRHEGYIFTHIEELHEIVGIPESYLKKVKPLITFTYDINQEFNLSWRRLNTCSQNELIAAGIMPEVAQKILEERQKNGFYTSLINVKHRTNLPLRDYHF